MANHLLIAIPTYSRPEECAKHFEYWDRYKSKSNDVKYFVEPAQYEAYKKLIPKDSIIQTKNNCLLRGQKKAIQEYALEHKFKWVFKLDDDVRRLVTRGPYTEDKEQGIREALFALLNKAYANIGAISLPYRNELYPDVDGRPFTVSNQRLQSAYLIRPDLIETEYNYIEDFAQTIHVYNAGYRIPRTGLFAQDLSIPVAKENSGGHANPARKAKTTMETLDLIGKHKGITTKHDPDLGLTPVIGRYINTKH